MKDEHFKPQFFDEPPEERDQGINQLRREFGGGCYMLDVDNPKENHCPQQPF